MPGMKIERKSYVLKVAQISALIFFPQINTAKQNGVIVYNVGIGPGASSLPSDLTSVASEPSSRYVLTSQTYGTLDTLAAPLASRVASGKLSTCIFMFDRKK